MCIICKSRLKTYNNAAFCSICFKTITAQELKIGDIVICFGSDGYKGFKEIHGFRANPGLSSRIIN